MDAKDNTIILMMTWKGSEKGHCACNDDVISQENHKLWLAVEADLETVARDLLRSTFLGQTDPSAPSTSRTPDNVPDSQIPSVPQAVDHVAPYIPQYDDAAYFTYEEPRHDQQPHDP
ncbi:hypothetical protein Bca52824_026666 [Brassica carinata]|uniref:Uncharacterized protein n=1 Tax=Brassica carinata TaxID=52824 RepID=A0A8X7SIA8_BRACI|nr:hypothetical protein Bca52824_026666 [Brassica carinata]